MFEKWQDATELAEVLGRVAVEGKRNERELRECIRRAAALLHALRQLLAERILPGHEGPLMRGTAEWLALPAVQSALVLEAADRGE
jgi:hypothetical protein